MVFVAMTSMIELTRDYILSRQCFGPIGNLIILFMRAGGSSKQQGHGA